MMKKTLALLTALTCTCGMASSVGAEEVEMIPEMLELQTAHLEMQFQSPTETFERIVPNAYGVAEKCVAKTADFIFIETDGTALSEADVANLPYVSEIETVVWEEFSHAEYLSYLHYEVGTTVYLVHLTDVNGAAETARKLMLEHEFITNAFTLVEHYHSPNIYLSNRFKIKVHDGVELSEEVIPELLGFSTDSYHENTYYAHLPDGLFTEEMVSSPFYEDFDFVQSYADEIAEKYSHLIAKIEPGYTQDYIYWRAYYPTPIWENAGDSNSDGKTNAQDASQILMHAALAGAAVEGDVTISETNADVNADGLVNAKDAACVLIYAAAESAGLDLTWADVLRS